MNAPNPASYHALLRALLRQPDLTSDACLLVAEALDEMHHPCEGSAEYQASLLAARDVADALRGLAPVYGAVPLAALGQDAPPEAGSLTVAEARGIHVFFGEDERGLPNGAELLALIDALRVPRSQLIYLRAMAEECRIGAPGGAQGAISRLMSLVLDLAERLRP